MELIIGISTSIVGALLGVIAYFLKQIYSEFKAMKTELNQALTRIALTEERGRLGHKELSARMDGMEKRVDKMEGNLYGKRFKEY